MSREMKFLIDEIDSVNVKIGIEVYSADGSQENMTVFANSGPQTITYEVFIGTAREAMCYMMGVKSGLNTALLENEKDTVEEEFRFYWHDPAGMTSSPCKVVVWPQEECLLEGHEKETMGGYEEDSIFVVHTDGGGEAEVYATELSYIEDVPASELNRDHCTQCGCLLNDDGECQQGCEQGREVTIEDAEYALKVITTKLVIDMPSNHAAIAEFMRDDVASAADKLMWHSGDFDIAFRRYLEKGSEE